MESVNGQSLNLDTQLSMVITNYYVYGAIQSNVKLPKELYYLLKFEPLTRYLKAALKLRGSSNSKQIKN